MNLYCDIQRLNNKSFIFLTKTSYFLNLFTNIYSVKNNHNLKRIEKCILLVYDCNKFVEGQMNVNCKTIISLIRSSNLIFFLNSKTYDNSKRFLPIQIYLGLTTFDHEQVICHIEKVFMDIPLFPPILGHDGYTSLTLGVLYFRINHWISENFQEIFAGLYELSLL